MATPLVVCDRQFCNRSIHSCIVMPPPPGPARPAASSVRRNNTIGAFSPQRSRNSATSAANSTCTNASNTAIIAAPAGTPPRARNKNSAPTNPDVTFLASRASTWSRWFHPDPSTPGTARTPVRNRRTATSARITTTRTGPTPPARDDNACSRTDHGPLVPGSHRALHRTTGPPTPATIEHPRRRHHGVGGDVLRDTASTSAGRAPNRPSG